MALSDAQIDRFSRQIILPQIGGRGQERLLRASIALAGEGELAELSALSLAGAGIGRIALHGSAGAALGDDLVDLHPDLQVTLATGALGSTDADVLVACDLPPTELNRAGRAGRPLVAGGLIDDGGWLVSAGTCAVCAARQARREVREPVSAAAREGPGRSATTGVIASLIALVVLKLRLDLPAPAHGTWLRFDAPASALTERPLPRTADCAVCAAS